MHSRMREPSSALVTATHGNAVMGVIFDVDYDFIVRNRCFRHGNALRFLKKFCTFFLLNFGQSHGVMISVQPIKKQLRSGGKSG